MSEFLRRESDIWIGKSTKKSEEYALKYTLISLPWTFDRMRYDSTQRSTNKRLLNIFHGVLNQSILEETLLKKGIEASLDWSKYRESDIFDFKIGEKVFDVKTVNVYEDYNECYDRPKFSTQLVIENKDYSGSEWDHFFPCLITVSQITPRKIKDGYIFGIAISDSNPNDNLLGEVENAFWASAPFGNALPFFQGRNLIRRREEAGLGFNPVISWDRKQNTLFKPDQPLEITVYGEWDEEPINEKFTIEPGSTYTCEKEFSSLTSLKVSNPSLLSSNPILITAHNNLKEKVPKTIDSSVNINQLPEAWELKEDSFVNLTVPERYDVYWLGFTSFKRYLERFQKYPSYFCPLPSDPRNNQEARINESIIKHFTRIDRAIDGLESNSDPNRWPRFQGLLNGVKIKAGVLLSAQRPSGRVIGAGSYYYPGSFSFHESALYILPSDLYRLSTLEEWVRNSSD